MTRTTHGLTVAVSVSVAVCVASHDWLPWLPQFLFHACCDTREPRHTLHTGRTTRLPNVTRTASGLAEAEVTIYLSLSPCDLTSSVWCSAPPPAAPPPGPEVPCPLGSGAPAAPPAEPLRAALPAPFIILLLFCTRSSSADISDCRRRISDRMSSLDLQAGAGRRAWAQLALPRPPECRSRQSRDRAMG